MFHLDIFKKKFIEELWNEIPEWLSMLVIFASNLFGSHSAGKQLMRLFFQKGFQERAEELQIGMFNIWTL